MKEIIKRVVLSILAVAVIIGVAVNAIKPDKPAESVTPTTDSASVNGSYTDDQSASQDQQGSYTPDSNQNQQNSNKPGATQNQQGSNNPGSTQNQQGSNNPGSTQNQQGSNNPGTTTQNQQGSYNPGTTTQNQQGSNNPGTTTQNQQGSYNPGTTTQNQQGSNNPGTTTQSQQGSYNPGTTTQNQQGSNNPGTTTQNQQGSNNPGATQSQQGSSNPGTTTQNQQGSYNPGTTTQNQQGSSNPGTTTQNQQGSNTPGTTTHTPQGPYIPGTTQAPQGPYIPGTTQSQQPQYTNRIDKYQQIFASKKFLLKINDPELGPVTMAMSGNKMLIEASMEEMTMKMLYDGDKPDSDNPEMGTWYIIIDSIKKYSPMPGDMLGDMNIEELTKDFTNDSDTVYTKTVETLNGQTYNCESCVDENGNTTKYYFIGDQLVRSDSISPSGEISTTEFQEITGSFDESIFKIPDGYAKWNIGWILGLM